MPRTVHDSVTVATPAQAQGNLGSEAQREYDCSKKPRLTRFKAKCFLATAQRPSAEQETNRKINRGHARKHKFS